MFNEDNYKSYHLGPGYKTSGERVPMESKPNSFIDTRYKENGKLKQRRKFDKEGKAYLDLEDKHAHKPYRHVHEINNSKRSTKDRPLTKKEKNEFDKANKKRRGIYGK